MKICSKGVLIGGQVYMESPPLFLLRDGERKIVKEKGFEVTVEKEDQMSPLEKLFTALQEGKVGNHTVYYDGYLMMYVPSYGFGSFRVIKTEGEINKKLNELFLKLIRGEIDDLEYDKELYSTDVSIQGHTVAVFEESSVESGDVTWESVIDAMGKEPPTQEECVDDEITLQFDRGNISSPPLLIPIMRRADNVKLSSYITVADVIKGRFIGNIVTQKGVITSYKSFTLEEVERGRFTTGRICGRLRLETEKPCFYSDSISAYSEDEEELKSAVGRISEMMRKGKDVNF